MEQQMGTLLPPVPKDQDDEESNMTPEMEIQVSQMAAQASQQLLQQHQQQDQKQQAQQQAQDPLIQLQQQELQLKMQELQRKAAKDQADTALKQEQISVERERIAAQAKTAGAQAAVKLMSDRENQQRQHGVEGHKAGIDLIKHQQSLAHQREIAERQTQKTAKEQTKKGK